MRGIYLFFFVFFNLLLYSQKETDRGMESLVEGEVSRYSKMMSSSRNVNPNTLNYDLRYQRLELTLDPSSGAQINGKVTSHFIPTQDIASIYFDFNDALTVSEVQYHGTPLSFIKLASNELKIDFPDVLAGQVLDSLSISYSGVPVSENMITSYTRARQDGGKTSPYVIYTLSEPYGAKDWFPTKQSLNDKIEKVRVEVTTPTGIYVASNGKLISETAISGTELKTIWETRYPIPAYLIAIGVTNYTKYTDTIGTPPFPYLNYIYPRTNNNTALNAIQSAKGMMDLFEEHFGPYPYRDEKYGHMEFDFGGGMEHATMSSMGTWSLSTVAHELAHQWFGDKTTCKTWNDVWINEGFARFAEHLYNEKITNAGNRAAYISYLQSYINDITSLPGGSVYVSDTGIESINTLFSSRVSYNKGSYLLMMLKWMVGDAAFYQAIKDYSNTYAYTYATGMDFKSSFESSTGKDFTEFFNDWYFGEGYPIYTIKWKQESNQSISFMVSQDKSIASAPDFFEMYLPIKVTGSSGEIVTLVLDNTMNNQVFQFPLNFTVSSVNFNYENQVLTKGSTVINDNSFLASQESARVPIRLYPNPAVSEIQFSGLKTSKAYKIYTIDGKLMEDRVLEPQQSILVEGLPSGAYVIVIDGQSFKFIKK